MLYFYVVKLNFFHILKACVATKKENDRFVTGALIKLSTAARQYKIVHIYAKHITERLERFVRANL